MKVMLDISVQHLHSELNEIILQSLVDHYLAQLITACPVQYNLLLIFPVTQVSSLTAILVYLLKLIWLFT